MKLLSLITLIALCFSTYAVTTKNCPQKLTVSFSVPSVEKWYAIDAYEEFFATKKTIKQTLNLRYAQNAKCDYYNTTNNSSEISAATIKGSLRSGTSNPATVVTYLNLPIRGQTSGDIGDAVVYSKLVSMKKSKILVEAPHKLYFVGESCSWGDCVPHHTYLGTFSEATFK